MAASESFVKFEKVDNSLWLWRIWENTTFDIATIKIKTPKEQTNNMATVLISFLSVIKKREDANDPYDTNLENDDD